jgi:predicted N-acyltransferase
MRCRNFEEFRTQLEHRHTRAPFKKASCGLEILIHQSLDEFDSEEWNTLVDDDSIYLHTDYILAMIKSYESGLEYRFVRFMDRGELVGVAALQITHFETADLSRNMKGGSILGFFSRKISSGSNALKYNVLICGNAFASGAHGFKFKSEIAEGQAFSAILEAVDILKEEDQEGDKKISACLLKDYYPETFNNTYMFVDEKYSEFLVDPNMIMPVRPEWKSFDDYLDSLTSKYRTKAKAAYKRAGKIELREMSVEDMETHREDFMLLYNQVHFKADFRIGTLNFEAFLNYRKDLGDRFLLKGLFLEGKLVAFMSGFKYDSMLDAHFVGIDYEHNYEYALYSRMLYEYIDEAIARGVSKISFGRTAMEIKSTVGAFPVDLKIFIKHRSKAPNHLLRVLFSYVKPADFDQRVPYKKTIIQDMRTLV